MNEDHNPRPTLSLAIDSSHRIDNSASVGDRRRRGIEAWLAWYPASTGEGRFFTTDRSETVPTRFDFGCSAAEAISAALDRRS